MIDVKNIEAIYFVGIGGIGMSALARYFRAGGFPVHGYDRASGNITDALAREGCQITFEDDKDKLPGIFTAPPMKDKVLVIVTPAIPSDSSILRHFRENGYRLYKRSEILGMISKETDALAVSGTHGKTTVSTMLAHILKQSSVDCSAFLGGISKNYDSNLILGSGRYTVMEADEFDRSFHRLSPLMAIVTAVDADHLEIYGSHEQMIEGYNEFFRKIRKGGLLSANFRIRDKIIVPEGISLVTYGPEEGSTFRYTSVRLENECFIFDLHTPNGMIKDIRFPFPGQINIENATAAASLALSCGVTEDELRKALLTFSGVQRRFDIRVNRGGVTYIDDYAHHPEEIRAFVESVKAYFGKRHLTGIFQPHLFTRTRDHAEGFARILDILDEVIVLPIYPAREKPIEGVGSEMIIGKMKLENKRLLEKSDIPGKLDINKIDVLLTIGAGDIDRLVRPIEEALKTRLSR
ncbi:MAG: UDP-N-acetylmuramate--L-alanine ligase [Bacteroidales bacterium]